MTEYSKRNTTLSPHKAVDDRNRNVVVESHPFSRAISPSPDPAVPQESEQLAIDPDTKRSRNIQNTDVMTISLATVTLFLLVVLIAIVVLVFRRRSARRGGCECERRWPTQKSLVSVGENDDSVSRRESTASSAAVCTKHNGRQNGDVSREFCCSYQIRRSPHICHVSANFFGSRKVQSRVQH